MGPEYECVRDQIIPYINTQIQADEAAFVYHAGDILCKLLNYEKESASSIE